ncbi:TFIIB-type zinc ribbon-containing protein [Parapedobacter sp.]
MNCPSCNETLLMSVRNQVEIDYCPKCRGIWLDRGELDKIIEQSERTYPQTTESPEAYPDRRYQERGDYREDRHGGYRKKKKSFLGDFFDFD